MELVLTQTTGTYFIYKHTCNCGRIASFNGLEVVMFSPLSHVFFWYFSSTKSMRNEGGFEVIKKAIGKLGLRHKEHIAAYGEGNERRLTGRHETADINTFLWVKIL